MHTNSHNMQNTNTHTHVLKGGLMSINGGPSTSGKRHSDRCVCVCMCVCVCVCVCVCWWSFILCPLICERFWFCAPHCTSASYAQTGVSVSVFLCPFIYVFNFVHRRSKLHVDMCVCVYVTGVCDRCVCVWQVCVCDYNLCPLICVCFWFCALHCTSASYAQTGVPTHFHTCVCCRYVHVHTAF